MDTPPPLPDVPPPLPPNAPPARARFKLPPAAFIAWGIYAVLRVGFFMVRGGSADSYRIGELVGAVLAGLLIPSVLAILVWWLSRRSATAGNVTFFVVFALAMVGQLSQFGNNAQAGATLAQIQKDQQAWRDEQRTALEQGREVDSAKGEKLVAQTSAQLGAMAANSSGRDRATAEGTKAFMDQLLATKQRYDAAIKKLDPANFWDLSKFSPGAPAEERRKAVRTFAEVNKALGSFQDESGTALKRALEEHGATPGDVREAVAGYKKGGGVRLGLMMKIRETDASIAQVMLDFIDFAESNGDQWQVNASDGKIIFQQDELRVHYDDLIKRANTISAEQSGYQRQVFSAKN